MMTYDYGRTARIGIGTPQANPTVEAEFGILLPRTCSLHVVRLTGTPDNPEQRLRQYLTDLGAHLRRFDIFKPDIFGFACTGSSYLLGAANEPQLFDDLSRQVGYPIATAAQSLKWMLDRHKAKRIAIAAPYPTWLLDASRRYWSDLGFEVVSIEQIKTASATDTRSIYQLGSDAALSALGRMDLNDVDAVLLSGTGMPSLAAIKAAPITLPLLSSNLCLAAYMMHRIGHDDLLDGDMNVTGWRERLAEALI
jgi:maleate isomerase